MQLPFAATTGLLALSALLASKVAFGQAILASTEPESPSLRTQGNGGRAGVSVERCIELAEQNYPKVREARARRDQKKAAVDVARYAPYSEFSVTAGLGLAPTVTGTSDYSRSTDTSLTPNMGLAWQTGVEGVLPLYTFGKMTHGLDAAESAKRASDYEIDKEKNDVRINVRRAYYGVKLARDARTLVQTAADQMDAYINKMQAAIDAGEGDDIQLLRMRVFRAELTVRRSEASKQEAVALSALRFLTGQSESLDVPDGPLEAMAHEVESLQGYLARARAHRPELAMARAAVAARSSLVKFETAKLFPDIGLGLSAKWSYAPEVTDQKNPFVRDGGNFLQLGFGLVAKYKLDFLPQAARRSAAVSQLAEVLATEQWAKSGIAQQVTEAYAELCDTRTRMTAMSEAAKYAKQWLIKVQQGIEVGTLDEEELVAPAKEFALKRFAEMQATYDYNVALAKLAQATGDPHLLAHQ